jgi:hypothetical protein
MLARVHIIEIVVYTTISMVRTPSSQVRERERGREREIKTERERGREGEIKTEREYIQRERGREREIKTERERGSE